MECPDFAIHMENAMCQLMWKNYSLYHFVEITVYYRFFTSVMDQEESFA